MGDDTTLLYLMDATYLTTHLLLSGFPILRDRTNNELKQGGVLTGPEFFLFAELSVVGYSPKEPFGGEEPNSGNPHPLRALNVRTGSFRERLSQICSSFFFFLGPPFLFYRWLFH